MSKILIGLVLMAPVPAHAAQALDFDAVAIEAFEQIAETRRAQIENRSAGAQEAFDRQVQAAQAIRESLDRLESSAEAARTALFSSGASDRLSLAVRALSLEMSGLTRSANLSASAIAELKRRVPKPGRNDEFLVKASLLASIAGEIDKRGRVAADDICLRLVLPLRRMRRVDEFRMLAGGAPAIKGATARMSAEASHLADFVWGDTRPGTPAPDPIPNFCNPEDIPPHG
jgi:hypothetical protein